MSEKEISDSPPRNMPFISMCLGSLLEWALMEKPKHDFPWYILLISWGCLLDLLSTGLALRMGAQEMNPFYVIFPSTLWFIVIPVLQFSILGMSSWIIDHYEKAPASVRAILPYVLAAMSFFPALRNLITMGKYNGGGMQI